ncbi:MAG: aldehyde dehydrogenase family protein, partial [Sphingorhabdus sp.]
MSELISFEPATGAELWRGATADVEREVAAAREAWPRWAAAPLADRVSALRSFGSRVRADMEGLAELIARETGKPMWEARTEVESVANKVDISIKAYADRTSQRLFDG